MKNIATILSVSILSSAVGAGIGLLYAPEKGEKTRKKLKNRFSGEKRNAEKKLVRIQKSAESTFENVKNSYNKKIGQAADASKKVVSQLQKTVMAN